MHTILIPTRVPNPGVLLFDLDGTLVDSLADIAASVDWVRARHGLPELGPQRVRAMIGDGLAELLHRALPDLDDGARAAAEHTYRDHHWQQCVTLVRPYPGVEAALAQWSADGVAMAVVTNKPTRFAERILAHLGLADWLPVVVGADVVGRKPSPEPCREALRRLGRDADDPAASADAAMVGDGVQDLRAGKAAGMGTIAALYGFREPELLRAEGADRYWAAFGVAATEPSGNGGITP